MIGVALDKVFISLTDRFEALANTPLQVSVRYRRASGRRLLVVANPLIHLGLGGVIILHHLLKFLFDRVIRVGCNDGGRVRGAGDEVGGRTEGTGSHERAQQGE